MTHQEKIDEYYANLGEESVKLNVPNFGTIPIEPKSAVIRPSLERNSMRSGRTALGTDRFD